MTKENTTAMTSESRPSAETQAERVARRPVYTPATDVVEKEHAIYLLADMPGVDEQGVEIHLEQDELTIRGRTTAVEEKGFDMLYSEFRSGEYERVFSVSNDIDRDGIKATIKNGVLCVELPKAAQTKPRKIAVQAG